MDFKLAVCTFTAMVIAFIFTLLISPGAIKKLHDMKFGQEVRTDGPETHLKKQGTPTMGGIIFMTAIILAVILCSIGLGADMDVIRVMFLTVGFGFTGFLDDYLKIKRHKSDGLSPKQKLLLQFVICLVFAGSLYMDGGMAGKLIVPFTGLNDAVTVTLPAVIFIPFVIFVVLGTDNGVNFTDGLDGLCSTVTLAVCAFFAIVGLIKGSPLAMTAGAVAGGLMGFLIYNVYPARVFMGDTGSLALGGFVAGFAIVTGLELYIPVIGFIYLIEVLSVIIQVTYFKKTGGKRFFRMAPIHHHFEKLGNSETRIVAAFSIATLLLCMLSAIGVLM